MKMVRNGKVGLGKPNSKFRFRSFKNDEGGSMIVFSLFLFVLMLIVGGMAVDFMRFESRRSMMQGALDSAVLAAADLDQQGDPKTVVTDYLTKSQSGNCLSGEPGVESSSGYRKVEATCELVLDTIFLGYVGMDTLKARAASTAIEGVGEIEVSLVVDISGSMREEIPNAGGLTRIQSLRQASTSFVNTLLAPEFADKVSLSLIPYSEDVNIGPDLYGTLTTSAYSTSAGGTKTSAHTHSYCVNLPSTAFSTTAWNNSLTYTQVPHFQYNPEFNSNGNLINGITMPVCPEQSYEQIIPISQDKTKLNNAIAQFQPRAGTSIFLGLKWAVNLLDPSFRPNIDALPEGVVDAAFDGRPVDYGTTDNPSATIKYIVLMTDGQNDFSDRVKEEYYNDPNDVAHWANMNWWFFYNFRAGGGSFYNIGEFLHEDHYTPGTGDENMQNMCTAAKDEGIIIFGIAMGSTENGQTQMRACASSTGHYYETSGDELTAIFEAIAEQITDLRLTL